MLHQDEGGIGKSIPDAREISRDPRDFPRAKPEGNLEGLGKSWGRRGWISQFLPSFGGVRTFSSSSILSLGMDQEIHPSRQGRIDSVKINPSLLMMRECVWLSFRSITFTSCVTETAEQLCAKACRLKVYIIVVICRLILWYYSLMPSRLRFRSITFTFCVTARELCAKAHTPQPVTRSQYSLPQNRVTDLESWGCDFNWLWSAKQCQTMSNNVKQCYTHMPQKSFWRLGV